MDEDYSTGGDKPTGGSGSGTNNPSGDDDDSSSQGTYADDPDTR